MKTFIALIAFIGLLQNAQAQLVLDTLAIQDFETIPMSPTWTYTGMLADVQNGYASPASCIPNTPLGLGGSQAWHVVSVSGGNQIVFDNTMIPVGYDSIRMNFHLAALNLNGATGGPDDLDYVLVEYSIDGGVSYIQRLRIRGAVNNNSFWAYDATGVASVNYLPASETVIQPVNTGLQTTEGYSFCQISFPGSITQLSVRITPRSSSSTDSWLVDNVLVTGEQNCQPTSSSIVETACDTYTAPSGAVYTTSGLYVDVIPNVMGCDSTINIDLTVNASSTWNDVITACGSYTWIDGVTYTANNNTAVYTYTTPAGCDSTFFLDLIINPSPNSAVTQTGNTLNATQAGAAYQWIDCDNGNAPISGATSQSFTATTSGNYAVEIDLNGCTTTSSCFAISFAGLEEALSIEKEIIAIYDLLGRLTNFKENTPLLIQYSDGSVERVMVLGK